MKKGFTLAEVLITLAIIGVVAALTIPTVVQNYQKTQVITQLKKTFSALANTTNLAIADHGPMSGWEIGENGSGEAAIDFTNKYMIPYLKVSKNCECNTTGECAFNYAYLNGGITYNFNSSYTRFYLNDGTLIGVIISNSEGVGKMAGVFVDINGQKKPNKLGRDIFYFIYYVAYISPVNNGKILAGAIATDRTALLEGTGYGTCNKNSSSWGGRYCSAIIMKDGWQIKDDYPWN